MGQFEMSYDFSVAEKSYAEEKNDKKQRIVRNEFVTVGKYEMPLIRKENIDINKIELWCFAKAKFNDKENSDRTINFFTYDWLYESFLLRTIHFVQDTYPNYTFCPTHAIRHSQKESYSLT